MKVSILLAIFAVGRLHCSDGLNLDVSVSDIVSIKDPNNIDDVASRSLKCTVFRCKKSISRSYKKCAIPYTPDVHIKAIYR